MYVGIRCETFCGTGHVVQVTCLELKYISEVLNAINESVFKTDSAPISSNKCKNYFLKIYSQCGNFFNTI